MDCTYDRSRGPSRPPAGRYTPAPGAGYTETRRSAFVLLAFVWTAGLAMPAQAASTDSQPAASAPLPVDEAQERALLRAAGPDFQMHRTPHFLVAFDTPTSVAKSLSSRLEQTYDSVTRFCERSGFPAKPLTGRLEVIFFNHPDDYGRYARPFGFNSKGTYGFYSERGNRSAFYNVGNDPELQELEEGIQAARESLAAFENVVKNVRGNNEFVEVTYANGKRARLSKSQAKDELESRRRRLKSLDSQHQNYCDRINRTVIQHEVAHHVLYNNGLHARMAVNPKWLIEGLACMFETPPGNGGSGLSAINQARLKDFRNAVAGESAQKVLTAGMYTKAVAEGRITSLEDLIRRNELFDVRGDEGARHYAAAWALVHYLHRTQSKAFPAYLKEVAARRPGTATTPDEEVQLFEKHFGPLDVLAVRFSGHVLSLPLRSP